MFKKITRYDMQDSSLQRGCERNDQTSAPNHCKVKRRKLKWFGHVIRLKEVLREVEGREGYRRLVTRASMVPLQLTRLWDKISIRESYSFTH